MDSVSGRRIQDVSSSSNVGNHDHVLLHLGTNNIPKESPMEISKRMERLIMDVRRRNSLCTVYVSSVLPRATTWFSRKKMPRNKIEDLNDKATTVNILFEVLVMRYVY